MYVDSHCHLNMLDLTSYDNNLQNVLDEAAKFGVKHFLCVAVTLDDHEALVKIAENYPNIYISTGLHPNENPDIPLNYDQLFTQAQHPKVIAIGETGLDYYRSSEGNEWQKKRFIQHMDCAREIKKPLIIHTRNAKEDTIKLMREHKAQDIKGVMHCFTEDWETAQQALDLGFYISFSGIVTFKNAVIIQEVASKVPLNRMLIETDCPYLAPMPHRGKPNVPGYVSYVGEFIAKLRGEEVDTIAKATTQNFFELFPSDPA